MKKTITLSLLLFSFLFLRAQDKLVNNIESNYPYWDEYQKIAISKISNPKWITKDSIVDGWDWSLPKSVEPSDNSNLCIARSFDLDSKKIEQLPKVNFSGNPVISHWVKWRDLEPKEGEISFKPLIKNIKNAYKKGYGSIVRIHFSATDFAPDWIKKYDIPIRKEHVENPKKKKLRSRSPRIS
jgi:hypothetical protein